MHHVVIQCTVDKTTVPKLSLVKQWAKKTLQTRIDQAELTIRITDADEMTMLNTTYRKKKGPTNVLSFPFSMEADIDIDPILGDIVICAEVVNREAKEQGKEPISHWAHMVVHGIYHLLGYDHENDKEAEIMEQLEIATLKELGFTNPYESGDSIKNYE